ncbi:hypothetical protein C5E08_09440 [Rathayibacter iranicus]|uniref:Uncharacterized protein n=1 Tax=Rathayibacter iranicus TaxID=59737 RepID=A0AAD1AGD9_9MICO|nr:hypothetical protein C7V51_09520 [Rathayibacter iranicus]PPI46162.1 hypothetical protein C5E09_08520 [Rathayibacter iranicus]PPI59536.1 hypothetical protein C5E08_09440 [Rathayibacter iranicus]PPI71014.1 hypothetical protein C5E01_08485 [Rathayibacter iranicus]
MRTGRRGRRRARRRARSRPRPRHPARHRGRGPRSSRCQPHPPRGRTAAAVAGAARATPHG